MNDTVLRRLVEALIDECPSSPLSDEIEKVLKGSGEDQKELH